MVYEVSCQECNATYIRQTGRNLSQCLKEHQRAVKNTDTFSNAMSEHVCQTGHKINWENPIILAHHPFSGRELSSNHGTSITNIPPSIERRVHCPVLTCHSRLALMRSSPPTQRVQESKMVRIKRCVFCTFILYI